MSWILRLDTTFSKDSFIKRLMTRDVKLILHPVEHSLSVRVCETGGPRSAIGLMFFKVKMNGPLPSLVNPVSPIPIRDMGLCFFFFFMVPDSIYGLINISEPKKTLSLMSSVAQLAGDVSMDIVNWKWKKRQRFFDVEIVTSFDGATYMDSSSTAGGRRTVSVTFSGKRKKKKKKSISLFTGEQ